MSINREILKYPRDFRLSEELDNGSKFDKIDIGCINEEEDMTKWRCSFFFDTGHCIEITFSVPKEYPEKPPYDFKFEQLKNFEWDGSEDYVEMKTYKKKASRFLTKDFVLTTDILKSKLDIEWDKSMFLCEYLLKIKSSIF